ncbi:MAG: hypothetical protein JSR45_07910 [Proteobacteria bacterium]|nr:hypothetical protein [Pseudomonadota bacterium]
MKLTVHAFQSKADMIQVVGQYDDAEVIYADALPSNAMDLLTWPAGDPTPTRRDLGVNAPFIAIIKPPAV